MKITRQEVEKIAKLAKLSFSEKEIDKFTATFSEIVEYVAKLNKLNTDKVVPTSHAVDLVNVKRADDLKTSDSKQNIMSNAPSKKDNYFQVPSILKETDKKRIADSV